MDTQLFVVVLIIIVIISSFVIRDTETIVMMLSVINASMWFYIGNMTLETRKLELAKAKNTATGAVSSFVSNVKSALMPDRSSSLSPLSLGGVRSAFTPESLTDSAPVTMPGNVPGCPGNCPRVSPTTSYDSSPVESTIDTKDLAPPSTWRRAPIRNMGLMYTPAFNRKANKGDNTAPYDQRVQALSKWRKESHLAADVRAKNARNPYVLSKFFDKELEHNARKEWWDTA